jgi:hypothetical protein
MFVNNNDFDITHSEPYLAVLPFKELVAKVQFFTVYPNDGGKRSPPLTRKPTSEFAFEKLSWV